MNAGLRILSELCRLVRENGTAAVEWRNDKKRRLFFFRAGVLVLVQSNLKSESPERVAERAPGLDPPDVIAAAVAQLRVDEALGETAGEVLVHPNAPAPGFEPFDAVALLWGASERLPPPPPDSFPRAVPLLAPLLGRIPAGPEVTRYLLELDGTRPIEDVVDFGPDEPAVITRALALALALGAVESRGHADTVTVRGAPTPASGDNVVSGGSHLGATAPMAAPSAPMAGPSVPLPNASAPAGPSAPPAPKPAAHPAAASAAGPLGAPPLAPARPLAAPRADLTVDDIADLIRDEITTDAPTESPGARPDPAAARPAPPPPAATPPAATPTAATSTAATQADAPTPFGGASVTVTFGGGRPAVPAAPVDPMDTRFGPALARIRGAKDHFAVLGTNWEDAAETHRRAYFALAQRLHPDRYTSDPNDIRDVASELFDRVRAAWEVLGDDTRREAYIGRVIRGEKSEEEKATERMHLILDAEADFKRGVAELNAGRLPGAHELFQKASKVLPEELEFAAYAGFTTFRLQHGRDEAAADEGAARVQAAVQANEKLDNVWVLHGIIQRMRGNEAAARKAFITALKLRPTNPDAARELKRLERGAAAEAEAPTAGGFLSRLFGRK